jgi:hypothetical protein
MREHWPIAVRLLPSICAIRLPGTLSYRSKLASHAILGNASATKQTRLPSIDFLSNEEKSVKEIDPMTGLSPELLGIIQDCNELAFDNPPDQKKAALSLHDRLSNLEQELSEKDLREDTPVSVVQNTAEAYRLGTILYLEGRILRCVPNLALKTHL